MMVMCAVPAVQQSRSGAAVQQRACGPVRTAPAGLQHPVSSRLPEHGLACQARHRRQPATAASTADPTTHHITAGASAVRASIDGGEWAANVASADDLACQPADDHRTVMAAAHHHPAADSAVRHGLGPTTTR